MSNRTTVKNSRLNDLVNGDKHVHETELLPLEKAIKAISKTIEDNPEFEGIIEELAEYITDRPGREIVGVEKKLENGGRQDLLEDAVYLKNKFERFLAKKQLSLTEQNVYAHVLAAMETSFNQLVRPLIQEGRPRSEVDLAVHKHIVEPVYASVVGFNATVNTSTVQGMLYFLTGKCHLLWV